VIAFIEAWLALLCLDLRRLQGFRAIRIAVAKTPTAARRTNYDALTLVRVAMRDASIFYFRPVQCLQRSAAVTRMLRRRGIDAQLVIGYCPAPFDGHAWVEVDTEVVWDAKPTLRHFYVLDRL
jgi:hypothetical protein